MIHKSKYIFLFSIFFVGCSSSFLYSPSMQLPGSPLHRDEGQIMAGAEMLPETRPIATSDNAQVGTSGLIRYAFGNRLTLQAKTWWGMKDVSLWESGAAFSAIEVIGDTNREKIQYGLMFTTAFVTAREGVGLNDWGIGGTGFALSAIAWIPLKPQLLTLYTGIGPVYGVRNTSYNGYGYGAVMNAGLAYQLTSTLNANFEAAGVFAYDVYDKHTSFVLSPGLFIGWQF